MRGCLLVAMLAACRARQEAPPPVPSTEVAAATASVAPPPPPLPECPEGMAHIEGFCIDRHEAHLVDADAPDKVLSPYDRPDADAKLMARSRAGVVPQGYLNRFEAAKACAGAGKRLCAAKEWYRACAGARGLRYPYGNQAVAGRCNTGKEHVMQKVFGKGIQFSFADHFNSPRLNREPGFLAPAGAYTECVTEEGVFDMVGNLHEWVADPMTLALKKKVPIEIVTYHLGADGNGIFMGGYYSSHGEHGAGCAYATTNHKPDYHDYSIGFRCCTDAG